MTDDARSRAHDEAQAILRRVMAGESKFDDGPKPAKPAKPPRVDKRIRYDRAEIVRLHTEEGKTAAEIAEAIGCSYNTAINGLKAAGVYAPQRLSRTGRPPQEFCDKGHRMADTRVESRPGKGDWHCGECKRLANRDRRREQVRRRLDNRLIRQRDGWVLVLESQLIGTILCSEEVGRALEAKLAELSKPRNGKPLD